MRHTTVGATVHQAISWRAIRVGLALAVLAATLVAVLPAAGASTGPGRRW